MTTTALPLGRYATSDSIHQLPADIARSVARIEELIDDLTTEVTKLADSTWGSASSPATARPLWDGATDHWIAQLNAIRLQMTSICEAADIREPA